MATVPTLGLCFMPTYEYACEKCGKNFDIFQSMRDTAFTECPKEHCQQKRWGHGKVKRLLGTGAGLIFKGSGFYITDYRSANYKEGAKKDAPAASGSDKPATGKEGGTTSTAASTPAKTPEAKPKKPASDG
jgi:putative FmdB family regulatory protein